MFYQIKLLTFRVDKNELAGIRSTSAIIVENQYLQLSKTLSWVLHLGERILCCSCMTNNGHFIAGLSINVTSAGLVLISHWKSILVSKHTCNCYAFCTP